MGNNSDRKDDTPKKTTATKPGGTMPPPPFPPYQEIISAALLSYCVVNKDAPHQVGPTSEYDRFECIPSDGNEMPLLMDWIALFFTVGSDDVVAAAISENSEDTTLYIALNKGSKTKKHTDAWGEFKSAVAKVSKSKSPVETDSSTYDFVLAKMLSTSWEKALSRVQKLKTVLKSGGASADQLGSLKGIIECWFSQCGSGKGKHVVAEALQKTQQFLKAVMELDGKNAIGNTDAETIAHRLDFFKRAINACRPTTKFDYLRNGVVHNGHPWDDPFEDENSPFHWVKLLAEKDRLFLIELSYALQRLLDYHDGLEQFLSNGAKLLLGKSNHGNNTGEIQNHLKVVWVTNPANSQLGKAKQVVWKDGSEDWFSKMPQLTMGVLPIITSKEAVGMAAIRKHCAGFWKKGDIIATNIHVEIKLVYFLQQEGIATKYNIIGVSSPLCIACESYFDGIANSEGPRKRWSVRKSSGKFVKDWLCPPTDDDHPVGSRVWARRAIAIANDGAGKYYYLHLRNILRDAGALEKSF